MTSKLTEDNPLSVRIGTSITLIMKAVGVLMAANEAFFVDPPRDGLVFGIAAFMMAGATGLDGLIDRFLGGGDRK